MSNVLVDIRPFKYRLLTEAKGSGPLVVEGLMQVAGDINGNGRIYPREILEREVDKFKKTFIAGKNAYGELDHPESPIVSLKNASHVITDLWWEGDNVMGRIEILNTPFGNIVENIIRQGFSVGISSRGTGSVSELGDGRVKVNDDFELVTWDFVSNPSVFGAFMKPVGGTLSESLIPKNKYTRVNLILNDILRN